MDKKNFFSLLMGTAIIISSGISNANARLFNCLSSEDSTVVTLNPLQALQYPTKAHPYQPLEEEGLNEIFSDTLKNRTRVVTRNFVYKLKGKNYKTLNLLDDSDTDVFTDDLVSSSASLSTNGNSQFSDLTGDPSKVITSSYNVVLSQKQYKDFMRYIKQTNNNFTSHKDLTSKSLAGGSLQSEE
ncbi:hypothetical protein [Candidatus Odyssella acanthamoebae]|uniref:Uncharacterized protein n=1 Tax=Candidatus Odyssella acanthamoebae TaxID=91604 RepID=A0A077AXI7_9PROT|nr:hypothetical protein [Candidatus Paracaedibacter acanthamoebae]AIK96348.1 hypothetical protein ID47_05770 [Candidatus Paracaedibacter acanthamoebae]